MDYALDPLLSLIHTIINNAYPVYNLVMQTMSQVPAVSQAMSWVPEQAPETEVDYPIPGATRKRPTIPISSFRTTSEDATVRISWHLRQIISNRGEEHGSFTAISIDPLVLLPDQLVRDGIRDGHGDNWTQARKQRELFSKYLNDEDLRHAGVIGEQHSPTSGILLHLADTILGQACQREIAKIDPTEEFSIPLAIDKKIVTFLRAVATTLATRFNLATRFKDAEGEDGPFLRIAVVSPVEWNTLVNQAGASQVTTSTYSFKGIEVASETRMVPVYKLLTEQGELLRPRHVGVCLRQTDEEGKGELWQFTGLGRDSTRTPRMIKLGPVGRGSQDGHATVGTAAYPNASSLMGPGGWGRVDEGSSIGQTVLSSGQWPVGWTFGDDLEGQDRSVAAPGSMLPCLDPAVEWSLGQGSGIDGDDAVASVMHQYPVWDEETD